MDIARFKTKVLMIARSLSTYISSQWEGFDLPTKT